jgi:hypothetical protein
VLDEASTREIVLKHFLLTRLRSGSLTAIHFKSIVISAIIDPTLCASTSIWFWVLNCKGVGGKCRGGEDSGKLRGKYKKIGASERTGSLKVSLFGGGRSCVPDNTQVACRVQPSGHRNCGTPRGRVPLPETFRPSVLDGQQTDFLNKAIVRNHWTGEYYVGSRYWTLSSPGMARSLLSPDAFLLVSVVVHPFIAFFSQLNVSALEYDLIENIQCQSGPLYQTNNGLVSSNVRWQCAVYCILIRNSIFWKSWHWNWWDRERERERERERK